MASRSTVSAAPRREVVLVGAGHAHIQVLRAFAMRPPPATRLTLVVDTPIAVYSGMVPGLVAGHYRADELEIDAVPLARRAGARVILAAATRIDPEGRRIELAGRAPIPYDFASLDIGSTVAGAELPGIAAHALPTRPIARLVERLDELLTAARGSDGPFRLVVAGGGAAGVELAACLTARLRPQLGERLEVLLVHAGEQLLPGFPEKLVQRVERALARRGIERLEGRAVLAADEGAVELDVGSTRPCDALVWATGAVGHPVAGASGLAVDARGFARVRSTLQVVDHDQLFAAGDCATLDEFPATPKAGVYAVRQGPVLVANLRAALAGRPLARYRPQRDFLALLNLGDGEALGTKRGLVVEGRWVMRLKDQIDRRFVRRFQPLAADRDGMSPGDAPMHCGGCAAKLDQDALGRALARLAPAPAAPEVVVGLGDGDDVAAVQTASGELLVLTVDFFRAFTDDPWLVGRVAAANALSDLEAKGVAGRWAQALVALPLDADARDAEETLVQLLAGARATFDPAGVRLVGGHTARAAELAIGFAVQGLAAPYAPLPRRRGELAAGQVLLLTKPLGTGVLLAADQAGRLDGRTLATTFAALVSGHGAAALVAREAAAATDVTGFGLAGHLATLLDGSGLAARLDLASIPALPGALERLARGERSSFHGETARGRDRLALPSALAGDPRVELLFDPQTAGPLLLAVSERAAGGLLERLRANGALAAARIGEIVAARPDGRSIEIAG